MDRLARPFNSVTIPELPFLDRAERKALVSRHESPLWLANLVLVMLAVRAATAVSAWARDALPTTRLGAILSGLSSFVVCLLGLLLRSAVIGAIVRRRMVAELKERGLCPACGYDLRASTERCPECGTIANQSRTT